MSKQYNLKRFTDAQDTSYSKALAEIKSGKKKSHWMWFISPQIASLCFSETARFYAIRDVSEAEAYINHPILGKRLIEICHTLLQLKSNNAYLIFNSPDDLKLHSCMTLFSSLLNPDSVFHLVLEKFFNGVPDAATLRILSKKF